MDAFERRLFLLDIGKMLGEPTKGYRIIKYPDRSDWAREVAPGLFRRLGVSIGGILPGPRTLEDVMTEPYRAPKRGHAHMGRAS